MLSASNGARRGMTSLLQSVARPLIGSLARGSPASNTLSPCWARSVGSVQGDKLRGNIREAWEKREIANIMEKRKPEFFESFEVGDSVAVRSVNPYNPKRMTTFAGVCIAKKGSLLGTAFVLQNNVEGTGVIQQFAYYSPLLKGIQVVKRPQKSPRKAKLYHLEERPPKEWTVNISEAELSKLPKEIY